MLVATANVLRDISSGEAAAALGDVLAHGPDLVGLQEWGVRRRPVTRAADPAYAWVSSLYGENALGWRRDRFALRARRWVPVGGFGLVDPGARDVPVLPPRVVLLVRLVEVATDRPVSVVVYHLVPGIERGGAYRTDRPRLVARHRHELGRLRALVVREQTAGAEVVAMGDANFDGLVLPGLVSAWEGRREDPRGTLGDGSSGRKIDDVFASRPADEVSLLQNASDHAALLALRS